MKKILLLLFLALPGLVACQKDTVHEIEYEPYKSGHSGTVDGGGGNGVNGRPLESYSVESQKLAEGIPELAAALDSIEKILPPLAGDFLHILRDRSWFMVPVSLDQLPSYQIGTFFQADQLALQNTKEIWFDSRAFDPMKDADKAAIIMHELVMGVRLLEYADALDLCLADANQDLLKSSPSQKFDEKSKKCYQLYGVGSQLGGIVKNSGNISLDKEDYSNIRRLTLQLLGPSESSLNASDLKSWLKANRFRSYP